MSAVLNYLYYFYVFGDVDDIFCYHDTVYASIGEGCICFSICNNINLTGTGGLNLINCP